MNLFGVLEIGGSALTAERLRAEVVASNMANLETTHTPQGGPYQRRLTVFRAEASSPFASQLPPLQLAGWASGDSLAGGGTRHGVPGGVRIERVVADQSPPLQRYQPGHPDADSAGYVNFPAVNPAEEMTDLLDAVRAYELNASSIQAAKQMIQQSIDILR